MKDQEKKSPKAVAPPEPPHLPRVEVRKTYSEDGKCSVHLWMYAPDGIVYRCKLQKSEHDEAGNVNTHSGRAYKFDEVQLVRKTVKIWEAVQEV